MDTQKLNSAISEFIKKKKSNAAYYADNWSERKERKKYYQSFTKDKIIAMTEDEFLEYISKLWSMLIWGNKKYVVDKLIADNGFIPLKKQLQNCFMGQVPLKNDGICFSGPLKVWGLRQLANYSHMSILKNM